MKPKKITVKYHGYDKNNLYYSNELNFLTERDADLFISDVIRLMFGLRSYTKITTWGKEK